ncbi:hypothetical protein J1605_012153 [Eschrichtius robustus]|uniref:Uncharacterized protein n=1 Tax=Eschrichtius robustus TaxID=9764 RepID=A0AB34GKQ8_ESCRO|nr:hypothetical protein J1605_012153 [Eschrichtius robustus]
MPQGSPKCVSEISGQETHLGSRPQDSVIRVYPRGEHWVASPRGQHSVVVPFPEMDHVLAPPAQSLPASWSRPLTELTSLSLAPSLKHAQGGNASWSRLSGAGESAVLPRTRGSPVQPRLELGQGEEDAELQQAEAAALRAGRRIQLGEWRQVWTVRTQRQCPSSGLAGANSKVSRKLQEERSPLLWNFPLRQTISQREEVSSGSQKCPLKVHPVKPGFLE